MLARLLRWFGFSLIAEARELGARLERLEGVAGIDRALKDLTEGKGE